MKAIVFNQYGSPDVLHLAEVALPQSRADRVLVRVHAASVNDWDLARVRGELTNRVMNGLFQPKRRTLGGDVAGTVESVGENVQGFACGDRVYGDLCMAGFGTFAEYVSAPQRALAHMPQNMSFQQAAAIPQTGMLAVQGLFDAGGIRDGRGSILLNGAGGGVGTQALQLARPFCSQITCVDAAEKLTLLRELGADQVIDYRQMDFCSNSGCYDLILDARTTRSPFAHARALRPGGIYATVGGELPRLLQAYLLGGMVYRTQGKHIRVVALKPNRDLAFLSKEFQQGSFVPVIDRCFPLEETAEALRYFSSGDHQGKVVITVS